MEPGSNLDETPANSSCDTTTFHFFPLYIQSGSFFSFCVNQGVFSKFANPPMLKMARATSRPQSALQTLGQGRKILAPSTSSWDLMGLPKPVVLFGVLYCQLFYLVYCHYLRCTRSGCPAFPYQGMQPPLRNLPSDAVQIIGLSLHNWIPHAVQTKSKGLSLRNWTSHATQIKVM